MKPKFRHLRSLAIASTVMLSVSYSHAASLYWDGATPAGDPTGGAGTWDTSALNWDTAPSAGIATAWVNANLDTAVFGGAAGAVTLNNNIDAGGLRFNTTGYGITTTGFSLNFADTVNPNTILFNNIAAASITGPVGGTGNVVLSATNPFTAGTLTLNGTSTGGWSGSTTINAGMTMSLSGLNQALNSTTSSIILNGGGITLTSADDAAQRTLSRVSDSTGITSNGGTITYTTTTAASANAFSETIGSVTLNRGQLNLVNTLDKTAGSQTLALAGLSQSGTAAVTFSNAGGLNTTNDIIRVNGITTSTAAGQIIGPWATVGTSAAAQTDYAVYNSDGTNGRVVGANIAATAENTASWTAGGSNVTLSGATTLTGTRALNSLRYTGGTAVLGLGASSFNLETNGVLNGGTGVLTISTTGTGGLTTQTVGGNLYLNAGTNGITVSAPIRNNSGNVTLVKNGLGNLTLSSTTSNYSGGTVLNAGSLNTEADTNLGTSGGITVNGTVTWGMGGGAVTYARALTINEGGALTLASGNNGKTVTGVLSGNGSLFANHSTDFIFSNSANTFTGAIQSVTAGTTGYGLTFASIGDSVGAGLISLAGNSGTFRWTSASGSTTTLVNRQFALSSAGAVGTQMTTISALGITAASNLVINRDLLVTGAAGARALRLAGTNTGNNTFAGKITDGTDGGASVVTLVKEQAGLWILSGANTYTGATTINASGGTLQIGDGGTTGSLSASSAISIGSAATLAFNRSNNLVQGTDFSTGISGAGSIVKLGAGDLTLNSANTYTGSTTVTAGRILMTHASALQNSAYDTTGSNGTTIGLDVSSGLGSGTLTLGGLTGSVNLASAITAGYSSVTNLTLNPQSGLTPSYAGIIANGSTGMTLTKTGAGTQTLTNASNSFSGGIFINNGTLVFNNQGALGGTSKNVTFTGTSSLSYVNNTTFGQLSVNGGVSANLLGSVNGTFSTATGSGTIIVGQGQSTLALGNASSFTGNIRHTITGNTTTVSFSSLGDAASLGSGNLQFSGNSSDSNQKDVFLLNGNSGAVTFTNRQIEFIDRTASLAVRGGSLTNDQTSGGSNKWVINSSLVNNVSSRTVEFALQGSNTDNNEFAGVIGNGTGTISLVKGGSGKWMLSNSTNSFTGGVVINNGTLSVNAFADSGTASTLGSSGTIQLGGVDFNNNNSGFLAGLGNNSGTLEYTGSGHSTNRQFSIGDVAAGSSGGGSILNNSTTGALILSAATFNTANAAATLARNLTVGGSYTGGVNEIQGTIQNNSATGLVNVTKTGLGTWQLSGNNSYTGTTTVSTGTLVAGANAPSAAVGAFGNASSDVALGTAGGNVNASILIGGAFDVGRIIRNATSDATDVGTRVLTLGGNTAANSTFSGNIFLGTTNNTSKGIVLTAASGGQVTFSGVIQNPSGQSGAEATAAAALTAVTKTGAGTAVLSNNNTYTGRTSISEGTLSANNIVVSGGSSNLGNAASSVTLGAAATQGTLSYTGNTASYIRGFTIGGAGGGRLDVTTSGQTLTIATGNVTGTGSFTVGGAGNTTVSSSLAHTGGLTKTGAGTMTVNGTGHTYAGSTNVNAGTLVVNGNISTSVLTTVASGATIGGSGTVGALTVDSGGFINPGNSPGILTTGNYAQAGLYTAEINGLTAGTNHDQINVTGTVNIAGGSLDALFNTFTPVLGDLIFILLNDGTDAINGTYAGLAQGAVVDTYGGYDWVISYNAHSGANTFTGTLNGNDIALLAVVPEPNVAALLGALGGILLLRRRR